MIATVTPDQTNGFGGDWLVETGAPWRRGSTSFPPTNSDLPRPTRASFPRFSSRGIPMIGAAPLIHVLPLCGEELVG